LFFQNLSKDLCISLTENSRLFYWRQSWLTFKHYPIFGYGLNTFKHVAYRFPIVNEQHSSYAHNIFLNNLAEMGIIGGGLFILLIFYIYYQSFLEFKKSKNNIYSFLYLGSLSSLVNAMFDFDWHFFVIFLLTLIYLAFILSDKNEYTVKKTNHNFWPTFSFFLTVVGVFFSISSVLTISWQKTKPEYWLKYTPFLNDAVKAPYVESVNTIDNYMRL
jgi:cell division protein FtsW (lipid II flippase)